jgi:hypothetical protein
MKIAGMLMISLLTLPLFQESYAQTQCVSVSLESNDAEVELRVAGSEGCAVFGLYVQLERNGSIQVSHTPSGWTYGEMDDAVSWTTESEPVDTEDKTFGIQVQAQKPYMLHWIALDESMSIISEGVLVGE